MAFSLSELNVKIYSTKWVPVGDPEPFDSALLEQIERVEVTHGEYGNSVKLEFRSGDYIFLDLDKNDPTPVGTIMDKKEILIQKLSKGEQTCFKARTPNWREHSSEEEKE